MHAGHLATAEVPVDEVEQRGRYGNGKKAKAIEKKRRKEREEDDSGSDDLDASGSDSENDSSDEEDFSDAESDGEGGKSTTAKKKKKKPALDSDTQSVQARLQELGPRFTLKLMSVQKGTFDSEHGEYEYVRNGETDGTKHNRRKFVL